MCNGWHILRGQFCHSLTPLLVRFVTAGYAVWARFKFTSKSISFPWVKHHLHRVTTIWFIFSSENLHALDFNTLEQWIPCHAILDVKWNLKLCVMAITFSLFFLLFFSFTHTGRLNHRLAQWNSKRVPYTLSDNRSRKIIWPFHTSQEIENKISCSRKSQNLNSRGRKIDYFIPRITNHRKIKFAITHHGKSIGDPIQSSIIILDKVVRNCNYLSVVYEIWIREQC